MEILGELSLTWGKSKCLKMLGWIDLLEGELPRADENLKAALKFSAGIENLADEIETLEMLAELHARLGRPERSLALLIALKTHPAQTAEVKRRADFLEKSLLGLLSQSQVETARVEGRARGLDGWIDEELK